MGVPLLAACKCFAHSLANSCNAGSTVPNVSISVCNEGSILGLVDD